MNYCYSKVVGGIGNQLFIVAAGYAYSKKYGKKFAIDTSNWSAGQGRNPIEYKDNLFKNFEYKESTTDTVVINEKRFNYDELPHNKKSVSLCGYFQSFKYFDEVWEEFVSLLDIPDVNSNFIADNNVAIHVRRGDYMNYSDVHFVCNTKYFKQQMENFKDFQKNVFTDSVEYVINEFSGCDINIIKTQSELEDLTLMSKHDNIICSNSSFSWWASLLGNVKNRIIVPNKWFNSFQPHDDIYRSDFVRVPV